jgi:hypothetical protein
MNGVKSITVFWHPVKRDRLWKRQGEALQEKLKVKSAEK